MLEFYKMNETQTDEGIKMSGDLDGAPLEWLILILILVIREEKTSLSYYIIFNDLLLQITWLAPACCV